MRETTTSRKKLVSWLRAIFDSQFASEVPLADECCEYHCRKEECSAQEWLCCEKRKAYLWDIYVFSGPQNDEHPIQTPTVRRS